MIAQYTLVRYRLGLEMRSLMRAASRRPSCPYLMMYGVNAVTHVSSNPSCSATQYLLRSRQGGITGPTTDKSRSAKLGKVSMAALQACTRAVSHQKPAESDWCPLELVSDSATFHMTMQRSVHIPCKHDSLTHWSGLEMGTSPCAACSGDEGLR